MILVTGAAGFIGFHVSLALIRQGVPLIGLDNMNNYYDVELKEARLKQLLIESQKNRSDFHFEKMDLADRTGVEDLFRRCQFEKVIHLGAQAGVRYSLKHPHTYVESNLAGFVNIMEAAKNNDARHMIAASSSSVYGANRKTPFFVTDPVDKPISLYAATKRANELLAYSYAHLYQLPMTALRFFTVYGPWGRPDMALFKFTRAILNEDPIDVYNNGLMKRDFTYIDDIVAGILRFLDHEPERDRDSVPYSVYNLGSGRPIGLLQMIETLEKVLGKTAIKNFLPLQPGDMLETFADLGDLEKNYGPMPHTPLETGIENFVRWYRDFYKI